MIRISLGASSFQRTVSRTLTKRLSAFSGCSVSFAHDTSRHFPSSPSDTKNLYSSSCSSTSSRLPTPLPAVAYDTNIWEDSYEDDDDDNDEAAFTSRNSVHDFTSPHCGRPPSREWDANMNTGTASAGSPYPPPSAGRKTGGTYNGSGGGGGGRHRCPKCGTYVTFRHTDFEENTFYCAACSGWFVVSPSAPMTATDQPHRHRGENQEMGGFTDKSKSQNPDPNLVMQHIPEKELSRENRQHPPHTTTSERITIDSEELGDISSQEPAASNDSGGGDDVHFVKQMPTPREIMKGLDEYVIGQRTVKVALSVGVYNHYKRILVAESQHQHSTSTSTGQSTGEGESASSFAGPFQGPPVSELNLGQFGSSKTGGDGAYCEAPDINSIAHGRGNFARDVEDCEIDKSNIMLLGPTGSGKTLLVKTLARLIDVPFVEY